MANENTVILQMEKYQVELKALLEQWVKSEAVYDRNQQIAVQEVLANRTRDILYDN